MCSGSKEQRCKTFGRKRTSGSCVNSLRLSCLTRTMEYLATIVILVAIATPMIRPICGQGWTFQPIGGGWQSDANGLEDEEEFILDYRYITYQAALSSGAIFRNENLVSFVQLVIDEERDQLLVGGRDVLYRLNLNDLRVVESADWASDDATRETCKKKGQEMSTCHNFIRVLLIEKGGERVFACGTNAFNPTCTWRTVHNMTDVLEQVNGRAICPFSPSYNATALISNTTGGPVVFAATVIDFNARDPAITRRLREPTLRSMQKDSRWLNAPNFIDAYEIGNYVYIFFRETAVEHINCGKKIFSRVARLCKNDKGGYNKMRGVWTSFMKARLNCSLPGRYPFHFDELQSTFLSEDDDGMLIYAVFTTSPNGIAGSAVCVYNRSALTNAFDGDYKYQQTFTSAWLSTANNRNNIPQGTCGQKKGKRDLFNDSQGKSEMNDDDYTLYKMATKYQLMDQAVQPRETEPLIMREQERWTHIVVDHVLMKNGKIIAVLFLATDDGKVRKMIRIPETQTTCLIEEIKIVANGKPRPVQNMKISQNKQSIYISTKGNVIMIPVERCKRFTTEETCHNAQDPYCGWNTLTRKCDSPPNGNPFDKTWEQHIRKCPVLNYPVDGKWSEWSEWSTCRQVGLDRMVDQCLCRSRACDRPKPRNFGRNCVGPSMEVSNCTVHGGWTSWSAWGACSVTCGMGFKHRHRQCGNPPPKFGGHDCMGLLSQTETCSLLPCPIHREAPHWERWGGWTSCTKNCNTGVQTRKRRCGNNHEKCPGNEDEWRMCNVHQCPEIGRNSGWTEWIPTNKTGSGYFMQRFRFRCRAPVEKSKAIKITYDKSEVKHCTSKTDQTCMLPKHIRTQITSLDAFSKVDGMLKKYCRQRRRLFKRFCRCRTLGVFLVCQKCGSRR